LLPIEEISAKTLNEIEHAVLSILQNGLERKSTADMHEPERIKRRSLSTQLITVANPQGAAPATSQNSAAF